MNYTVKLRPLKIQMKLTLSLVTLLGMAGCNSGSGNVAKIYDYADQCADRRTNELYARVAAQDVSDEELKGIVNQCYEEAQSVVGKGSLSAPAAK